MAELSVIVPFVQEWPQVAFTIRSIAEELIDRVDFEIIAVDNWCEEVENQKRVRDRSSSNIKGMAANHKWLRYMTYADKLSHWNAKNTGVQATKSKFLWFCDAHCIVGRDALYNMFQLYKEKYEELDGSIHLPLTYHILEKKKLIYSLKANRDLGTVHYTFSGCNGPWNNGVDPFEVPCMSTCGMMLTRDLYDQLGGWPEQLGIYGGGENFINFTLAVLGKKKYIMPGRALYHHGDKRGYHWNHTDYTRNRIIANFMFGDSEWAMRLTNNAKGRSRILRNILLKVMDECQPQREHISKQQKMSIEKWLTLWKK